MRLGGSLGRSVLITCEASRAAAEWMEAGATWLTVRQPDVSSLGWWMGPLKKLRWLSARKLQSC
jgi:hypothetical protein